MSHNITVAPIIAFIVSTHYRILFPAFIKKHFFS